MFISLNWIKDYVDLPKNISPEELGLLLTKHTVEVDAVINEAEKYAKVIVGEILEVTKHPNADKLQLAKVSTGIETLNIVCGAPNIKAGQKVPLALIGAILPNGLEIKEAEVRGEKSSGMLCAEDELGLGADHSGIVILDGKAKIGQSLGEYLKLDDVIYEIDNKSITNRPDLWGHYGMAREIALISGGKFKEIKNDNNYEGEKAIEAKVSDKDLCPRYMAVVVEGVKVGESPEWMQKRLIAVGMRPINNIVDITNYVMLETGQPLHAFDRKTADMIMVRKAKQGETITTLDGEERKLDEEMLVIADSSKPIAVAGVMGGENSEISDETESIIIESANFEAYSVRTTAQKLGLRTEASMRFEKSLDPNLCQTAILRTIELIKESCPDSKVLGAITDASDFKLNEGPIDLDLDWLALFIGEDLGEKKILEIFDGLGFGIEKDGRVLKVKIPSWRATKDISIREDLAEEVARIYGYDNLKTQMPKVEMGAPIKNKMRFLEREIKYILAGAPGLSEVQNYSFIGEDLLRKVDQSSDDHLGMVNPINKQSTLLRQSLAPHLFTNVKTNQAKYDDIGLFEIGSIFMPFDGDLPKEVNKNEKLPFQEKRVGLVWASDNDDAPDRIKGIIEYLLKKLELKIRYEVCEAGPGWGAKDFCADLNVKGKRIGYLSKMSSETAGKMGIKKKQVFAAEISMGELFNLVSSNDAKKYIESAKFPPVMRDIAFVVDEKITYNDIVDTIISFDEIITNAEVFDIYRGEKLGKGKKNLAFHITYLAPRTLTSAEVDEVQKELIKKLEEKFEAQIRNF